jgi:Protein of unknown function (DUF2865)
MIQRISRLLALCAFLAAAPALAQSPQCDGWRAEVARIDRSDGGGNAGAARQAGRVGADLNRTIGQYRGLGCEQAGGFFGPAPHPSCGVLRQRIGELQGAFGALQRQAQGGGGGNSARRGELVAAINAYCRPGVFQTPQPVSAQPQPARPRGFFEALFGLPEQRTPVETIMPQPDPLFEDNKPKAPVWGAGRPVCVRACDGFFFPLATAAGGREGADEMCQALCPAAETNVFYMGGNGEIEQAAGRTGPYTSLANASRYTRSFDSSCSCRKPGQSWASALAEAEDMLDRRKGDLIVTAAKAEELSRPRETRETRETRRAQERALERAAEQRKKQEAGKQEAGKPTSPEARVNEAIAAQSPEAAAMVAATESQASAGIGPQAITTPGTVSADQGRTVTLTSPDGEQRTVRMVAPSLTPQAGPDITVRR